MDLKETLAFELEQARRRSLGLVDPIPEDDQLRQQSPLMSPLVWDLAHVGNYEELWLLRVLAGMPTTSKSYDDMYNPFIHPRFSRNNLPLLGPKESREYISEVRGRVMDVLERIEFDPANPLLAEGFVYGMVVQHEHQHDETMLATRQLMLERSSPPEGAVPAPGGAYSGPAEVLVPAGPVTIGTDLDPWAYDNERPAHEVDVDAFWIDATPVTNRAFLEFVDSGAYSVRSLWTEEGWDHVQAEGIEAPHFWSRSEAGWQVLRFGRTIDLRLDEPVQHVCWYEADAYARWAGKRLATEIEWEKAASLDPEGGKRRFPWGNEAPGAEHANLGQRHDGPAEVGAYPGGASASGCHQMIGDVWEWTGSDFTGYPGFETFPYKEYSEVFFGAEYKVLRGGSWATHPQATRATFRNWDYPIRRQIFAGFRCARDA